MEGSHALTAAVIGDVVGSRALADRAAAQQALDSALTAANDRVAATEPLQPTIGDEFQGRFRTVEAALTATLRVQLAMTATAAVRFGVGWGQLLVRDPDRAPYGQDGPAWWAARAALEDIEHAGRARGAFAGAATGLRAADDVADPPVGARLAALRAMLACRDALVAGGDARDARLTLAVLDGASVTDCAAREGISPSAVSQRLRAGPYALVASITALREAAEPAAE